MSERRCAETKMFLYETVNSSFLGDAFETFNNDVMQSRERGGIDVTSFSSISYCITLSIGP